MPIESFTEHMRHTQARSHDCRVINVPEVTQQHGRRKQLQSGQARVGVCCSVKRCAKCLHCGAKRCTTFLALACLGGLFSGTRFGSLYLWIRILKS